MSTETQYRVETSMDITTLSVFTSAMVSLGALECYVRRITDAKKGDAIVPKTAGGAETIEPIGIAQLVCSRYKLKNASDRLNLKIYKGLNESTMTCQELASQLKELIFDLRRDIEDRYFVFIPDDRQALFNHFPEDWSTITNRFPNIKRDAYESAMSYCVGLSTASLFHTMRVAEMGLRLLAGRLKIKLTDKGKRIPIEFATWDKVITQCNNQIAALRQKSKGLRAETKLQFLSEAAQHCTFIKDIWRNQVSHLRKAFEEDEALRAIHRVHDFMLFLERGLPRPKQS